MLPEPDRRHLDTVLALASQLHREAWRKNWRKNEPYINHPLRVATRIITHYGIHDPDVIAAALLHDMIVKDHAADLAPDGCPDPLAALAELADWFVPPSAGLVADVTSPKYNPYRDTDDKPEQYR